MFPYSSNSWVYQEETMYIGSFQLAKLVPTLFGAFFSNVYMLVKIVEPWKMWMLSPDGSFPLTKT